MAWAKLGTPNTLSGTSDSVTISDLTSKKFNVILFHSFPSGSITHFTRKGNGSVDSGTNYSLRYSTDGAADSTEVNTTYGGAGLGTDNFLLEYGINLAAEEKLSILFCATAQTAGAANAPRRREVIGKWTNTSNQYDHCNVYNDDSGDYAIGTNLSAIGTD